MESKDKLNEIDTKNRTCYYFDDIIKDIDTYLVDTLLDKILYKTILVYDISYKTSMAPKPFRIWFNIIDGFIRIYFLIMYCLIKSVIRLNIL